MSHGVYYSTTRISALWKQTQQRRSQKHKPDEKSNPTPLLRSPQNVQDTAVSKNGVHTTGLKRVARPPPQRQEKKQREIYNHYAGAEDFLASELLDGDFANGGFGTEWEGMGCVGYHGHE